MVRYLRAGPTQTAPRRVAAHDRGAPSASGRAEAAVDQEPDVEAGTV